MNRVLFILVLLQFKSYSQKVELRLPYLPLRDGLIYERQAFYGCIKNTMDGLSIYSEKDTCYSLNEGVVSAVLDLGGEYAVLSKGRDDFFYAYCHLKKPSITKGDSLQRGKMVGLLVADDAQGRYELVIVICNTKGQFLSYREHLDFLSLINNDCFYTPSSVYSKYARSLKNRTETPETFLIDFSLSLPRKRALL